MAIYLGFGANLSFNGQMPVATLKQAIDLLPQYGLHVNNISPFYQSPPWLGLEQPDYVNAVIAITTKLHPQTVMQTLLQIEEKFGRQRNIKNASRTLDIDIIAWHDEIIADKNLVIPHPYLTKRAFVLMPLRAVAPHWQHPQTGQSIQQLIDACADCAHITQLDA